MNKFVRLMLIYAVVNNIYSGCGNCCCNCCRKRNPSKQSKKKSEKKKKEKEPKPKEEPKKEEPKKPENPKVDKPKEKKENKAKSNVGPKPEKEPKKHQRKKLKPKEEPKTPKKEAKPKTEPKPEDKKDKKKAEEEEKLRKEEEERKRKTAEEEARKKAEEEENEMRRKEAEENERKRKEAEENEAKKKAEEEEAKKKAEEEEAKKKAEEEAPKPEEKKEDKKPEVEPKPEEHKPTDIKKPKEEPKPGEDKDKNTDKKMTVQLIGNTIKIGDEKIKEITDNRRKKYIHEDSYGCKNTHFYQITSDVRNAILNGNVDFSNYFDKENNYTHVIAILTVDSGDKFDKITEYILAIGDNCSSRKLFNFKNIRYINAILAENFYRPLNVFSYSVDDTAIIDLSTLKINNCQDLSNMCYGYQQASLYLPDKFDKNVESMSNMFSNSKFTELNLANCFEGGAVENVEGMFYGCEYLKTVNLINFNFDNVTAAEKMFYECENLETIIVNDSFKNVVTKHQLFNWSTCKNLSRVLIPSSKVEDKEIVDALNKQLLFDVGKENYTFEFRIEHSAKKTPQNGYYKTYIGGKKK